VFRLRFEGGVSPGVILALGVLAGRLSLRWVWGQAGPPRSLPNRRCVGKTGDRHSAWALIGGIAVATEAV
jgi:hypothetical protein